jgi:hypothetical protein
MPTTLSITAASVQPATNASITPATCGAAAIAQGVPVYLDPSTNTVIACTSSTTALQSQIFGVTVSSAAPGQPINVQTRGDLTIGATVAVGTAYYTSVSLGLIDSAAGVSSNFTGLVGIGISTTVIRLAITQNDGTHHA